MRKGKDKRHEASGYNPYPPADEHGRACRQGMQSESHTPHENRTGQHVPHAHCVDRQPHGNLTHGVENRKAAVEQAEVGLVESKFRLELRFDQTEYVAMQIEQP